MICFAFLQSWSGICLLLGIYTQNISNSVVFVFGFILLCFLSLFFIKGSHESGVLGKNPLIITEKLMLEFFNIFKEGLYNGSLNQTKFVTIRGFVFKHKEMCTDSVCPLCKEETTKLASIIFLNKPTKATIASGISYINEIYKATLEKFPNWNNIRILYVDFTIKRLGEYRLAYYHLKKAYEKKEDSMWELYNIYKY